MRLPGVIPGALLAWRGSDTSVQPVMWPELDGRLAGERIDRNDLVMVLSTVARVRGYVLCLSRGSVGYVSLAHMSRVP